MLHPTRTNLLALKDRRGSVNNSIRILKARRQALIKEFISSSRQFIKDRREIRRLYRQAIMELARSKSVDGEGTVRSIASINQRTLQFSLEKRNIMGVSYHDISLKESVVRSIDERPYSVWDTSGKLGESVHDFERVAEAILELAIYESKLKRLGEEIGRVSRRTRVLEERILPRIDRDIRTIAQYLAERERESYYRLKRFKDLHA